MVLVRLCMAFAHVNPYVACVQRGAPAPIQQLPGVAKKRVRYEEHRPDMASILVDNMLQQFDDTARAKLLKDSATAFAEAHGEESNKLDSNYLARDTLQRLQDHGQL